MGLGLHAANWNSFVMRKTRQDKSFPRNKIRAQSSIKRKQMVSVDEKMADPQINISAVPQDFLVRGIEGKSWLDGKEILQIFRICHKRQTDVI